MLAGIINIFPTQVQCSCMQNALPKSLHFSGAVAFTILWLFEKCFRDLDQQLTQQQNPWFLIWRVTKGKLFFSKCNLFSQKQLCQWIVSTEFFLHERMLPFWGQYLFLNYLMFFSYFIVFQNFVSDVLNMICYMLTSLWMHDSSLNFLL